MTMVCLSRDNERHWSRERRDDDVTRTPDNKKMATRKDGIQRIT